MSRSLECFFDCSSPWTYLGFTAIHRLAAKHDVPVRWRPILVGGVFNQVNTDLYRRRANPVPAKSAYFAKDLQDWARVEGVDIHFPPRCGHPVNSVKCMRACIAVAPTGRLVAFATAAFEALWRDGRDLADDSVLASICNAAEVDPAWVLTEISSDAVKDALRANTDELIARGGFGSPTYFIDHDDMYFGNDRMPLIDIALSRKDAKARGYGNHIGGGASAA